MNLFHLIAVKMSVNLYSASRRARLATVELLLAACIAVALLVAQQQQVEALGAANHHQHEHYPSTRKPPARDELQLHFGDAILANSILAPGANQRLARLQSSSQFLANNNINNFNTNNNKHQQLHHYQHHQPPHTTTNSNNRQYNQSLDEAQLSKLDKQLNVAQAELVRQHPGSLQALARALKMAIVECRHQTRNEPWDCPVIGFGAKPSDIFGKLASKSCKETSFIHSLLASAVAHSVARACTEARITTCSRSVARNGSYEENVEFGRQFAVRFMRATTGAELNALHQQHPNSIYATSDDLEAASSSSPSHQAASNSITAAVGGGWEHQKHTREATTPTKTAATAVAIATKEPSDEIKRLINEHNDEAGLLRVLKGMRRDCKCHGLSGACTMETCWRRLPSFRDVAARLHESLYEAIRIGPEVNWPPKSRQLSRRAGQKSTSPQLLSNGIKQQQRTTTKNLVKKSIASSRSGGASRVPAGASFHSQHHSLQSSSYSLFSSSNDIVKRPLTQQQQPQKKQPVARSISEFKRHEQLVTPTQYHLIYKEDSPDFCTPSERLGIPGTKGRICSENSTGKDSCESLCCGRGYKTEVREERYQCDCVFTFCCRVDCKTCGRKKIIHKCL